MIYRILSGCRADIRGRYSYLDLALVGNSGSAILRWYRYIPDAEAVLRHGVGIDVPVVCQSQSSSSNMASTQRTKITD